MFAGLETPIFTISSYVSLYMPDSLTANLTQYPLAKTEFDGYASAAILTFLFFVLNKVFMLILAEINF
ncbi:MAG: hypothetical protein BWY47_00523 [Bacteroidetes bacterium ADurb.Bin302]|nr:MAG: hypothetical protein BWY47_00523 [Bacteroidetes bacterium ADurb.Bin302]